MVKVKDTQFIDNLYDSFINREVEKEEITIEERSRCLECRGNCLYCPIDEYYKDR